MMASTANSPLEKTRKHDGGVPLALPVHCVKAVFAALGIVGARGTHFQRSDDLALGHRAIRSTAGAGLRSVTHGIFFFAARKACADRWCWLCAALFVVCVFPSSASHAQVAPRIFERDPHDRILLVDKTVVEVVPLEFPNREIPENPDKNERLKVRLLDSPGEEFFLRWKDIKEIKLFEQMVLAEANALVDAGKFNDAFDYFAYLRRNYPGLPGLKESTTRYLYEEAKSWQREQQYEHAVAILNELYETNPTYNGLERALSVATGKLIEQRLATADHLGARALLRQLTAKFPENDVAARFNRQLQTEAEAMADGAREAFEAGRISEANEKGRRAVGIWPHSQAIRALYQEIYQAQPSVVVGVTQPLDDSRTKRLIDRATRRTQRLLSRELVEMVGYGPEGGEYDCPVGTMEKGQLGLKISFRLNPTIRWSSGDDYLTAHDVSRHLRRMAESSGPTDHQDWADLFAGVNIRGIFGLDVLLRYGHVLPEAFLTTAILPWNYQPNAAEPPPTYGPYRLASRDESQTRFMAIESYFAAGPHQPAEIIERNFNSAHQAVGALRDGRIAVVDRVNPWEVDEIVSYGEVDVEPYSVPSVHCLLLDPRHRLLARAAFRRALVFGIHREAILRRQLLRGQEEGRGQVLSGPFPVGYAYDNEIEPRGYKPRLAMSLAKLAAVEAAKEAETTKEAGDASDEPMQELSPQPVVIDPLTLAYPPYEIARRACRSIKRQLDLVKIPITLKELPAGVPIDSFDGYDLVYAELAVREPIVHARELLGPGGLIGRTSAYVELALRRLETAKIHDRRSGSCSPSTSWPTTKSRSFHCDN